MDPSSPIVCHIPDCATTQAEIELELESFLTGYCSICKKAREGKLCGCAFPCSLNFRAQMMAKIHQLLGVPQPPDRRFIQVCFKHPDLLKKAREACSAARKEEDLAKMCAEEAKRESSYTGGGRGRARGRGRGRGRGAAGTRAVASKTGLRHAESKDEGPSAAKMMKIQFGTTLNVGGRKIVVGGEGAMDQEDTEDEKSSDQLERVSVKRHNIAPEDDSDSSVEICERNSDGEFVREIGGGLDSNGRILRETIASGKNNKRKSCGRSDVDEASSDFSTSSSEEEDVPGKPGGGRPLRIQYEDYNRKILSAEVTRVFMGRGDSLCDVRLVCRDGASVMASGLMLAAASPVVAAALADTPRIDPVRTILMPDLGVDSMRTFLRYLIQPEKLIDQRSIRHIHRVAKYLQIQPLLVSDSRITGTRPAANSNLKLNTNSFSNSNLANSNSNLAANHSPQSPKLGRRPNSSPEDLLKDDSSPLNVTTTEKTPPKDDESTLPVAQNDDISTPKLPEQNPGTPEEPVEQEERTDLQNEGKETTEECMDTQSDNNKAEEKADLLIDASNGKKDYSDKAIPEKEEENLPRRRTRSSSHQQPYNLP